MHLSCPQDTTPLMRHITQMEIVLLENHHLSRKDLLDIVSGAGGGGSLCKDFPTFIKNKLNI